MPKTASLRRWATPLTIGAFLLMAVTGVVMFFEADHGLTTVVHQWFSWIFILGAGGHIAANSRPFVNYLKTRGGQASVAACLLVLAASFFSWGLVTGPQLERPIEQSLIEAPLSALAPLTGTTAEALLARLKAEGIAANAGQSVRDLARATGIGENRLLGIVFLAE
ncbi:DUF4405 domain-containing protein [Dongia sedimenti]|uniref:DUF4405 domain-containing protein n=1 Tax=Dongia sedimenti TaxID=3064282 RepID=A0ABU0YNA9_9PROT|nr:DUF4405 domain-containing protein [Rhodospirillaceae bacterium R-7]